MSGPTPPTTADLYAYYRFPDRPERNQMAAITDEEFDRIAREAGYVKRDADQDWRAAYKLARQSADQLRRQLDEWQRFGVLFTAPCETCGGSGEVEVQTLGPDHTDPFPCPDCTDGRVLREKIVNDLAHHLMETTWQWDAVSPDEMAQSAEDWLSKWLDADDE